MHIMVGPGIPRCLQVSAVLCIVFSFTNPSGKKLREEEKRKKEK
jgi:hypothetical protein